MNRPIVREHNTDTNEVVDRPMTAEEFTAYELLQADDEARKAEAEAKAQAKATAKGKLAALGLTTDDLRALGL